MQLKCHQDKIEKFDRTIQVDFLHAIKKSRGKSFSLPRQEQSMKHKPVFQYQIAYKDIPQHTQSLAPK